MKKKHKKISLTSEISFLAAVVTILLTGIVIVLFTISKTTSFDFRSQAKGKPVTNPSTKTEPYIVSAKINFHQTVDVNQNSKMNLRLVDRLDNNPTDTLNITISDIVLSNSRLRDSKYSLFVFATCKTNAKGLNWWGYPTRTWIQTGIPANQQSINVDFSKQVESHLLDETYSANFRTYFADLVNSGANCNIDLALKSDKLGAADMHNYAWYPYIDNSYFSTHPLSNHPYSLELLPENAY